MSTLTVENIKKLLIKKIRSSFRCSPENRFTYQAHMEKLIDGALHIATQRHTASEEIYREAKELINEWIRQEGLGDAQRDYQRQIYRPPEKTVSDDYFTLPWGQRIDDAVIASGIQNSAIEPKSADSELLEEDSAKQLFRLLDWIYKNWGPQAVGWVVLHNLERSDAEYKMKGGSTITDILRQIGLNPKDYAYNTSLWYKFMGIQRNLTKILTSIPKEKLG